MSSQQDLDVLRKLFQRDYPEAFEIFNLDNLEKDYLINQFKSQAFATIINQYSTGKTGAGKTSLGNCYLQIPAMISSGFQDCTFFIGCFRLKGNLFYVDTPGVLSNYDYDNINRVALCLPQNPPASRAAKKAKDLPFGKQPGTPYRDSDKVLLLDFTNCVKPEDQPEDEPIEVGQWQNDPNVKPDVIFYIVAPHQQFSAGDREYYETLLDKWKDIVIPVLNIHRNPDGTIKPTRQNIQDAHSGITEIYQLVFETDEKPPIFEVNCLTGEGIPQLTEYICQILPPEKVGNFGNVIKDDLKQFAQKQRQENYYHNLAIISGLLSRTSVKDVGGSSSLLHTAASALQFYGLRTFRSAEATDVSIDGGSVSQQADQIKEQKTVQKMAKEDIIKPRKITREVPVYGKKTDTRQEVVPTIEFYEGWFGRKIPYQTTKVVTLETTTSSAVTGYNTETIDEVKEVIGQTEKFVGTEYLRGGYEAIKFLLSVGLAVELVCDPENELSFNACFELAQEVIVEEKLQAIKSEIERLVDSDTGKKPLINLLEKALLG